MKKFISIVGALLLGCIAIAQVSKPDSVKKNAVRKVLPTDMKNQSDTSNRDKKKSIDLQKQDKRSGKHAASDSLQKDSGKNPKKK